MPNKAESARSNAAFLIDREAVLLARVGSAPTIAAGSTGSVPATARLMAAIARLDNGAVVLPGVDQDLDDAAWAALSPQDAQFGLKLLLDRLEVDRAAVQLLPGSISAAPAAPAASF